MKTTIDQAVRGLDQVQPANVTSVLRSCQFFRVKCLIVALWSTKMIAAPQIFPMVVFYIIDKPYFRK